MEKKITINVASFYQSNHKDLSWHIEDGNQSGTSSLDAQDASTKEISTAVEKHLQQISKDLPEGENFSDYEASLEFDENLDESQKKAFTAAFNESNTRDESY